MRKKVAVVTGASSGLGIHLIKEIEKDGWADEIWMIARREEKMEKLARQITRPAKIIPLDLGKKDSFKKYQALLEEENPNVRLLVNSAGFGKMGRYDEIPLEDEMGMVEVNCRAPVAMSRLTLPYMEKGARIMQVASIASFLPIQYFNVYAASKAFLLRYSRALNFELHGTKIRSTAICPFWMTDTGFLPTAHDVDGVEKKYINHYWGGTKAPTVARRAYRATKWGWPVCPPNIVVVIARIFCSIVPDSLMLWIWEGLRHL